MPHVPASTALSRFRILDLSRVRAGPTCVRQFADFGADVIKIESPPGLEAPMGGPREGPDFQNLHRNKRSITLNLKDREGVQIFMKLAKTADVVVENYRPDVKVRLGIDYESLKKANPRIVLASISGFGQDGPYRDRPGFDQIAQGMGGFMSITGLPGQRQVRHIEAAVKVKSPKLGEFRIVNQALKLSRTPATIAAAPPELGEHTAEVLAELGYDEAAIGALRHRKVI